MKRVVVLGLMGQYPLGGMAWQVLHHVIGFRRLGCECFYVENSGAPPYSPRLGAVARSARANVRFLADTFRRFDLSDAWSYYDSLEGEWHGMGESRARDLLEHAELCVNLCGASRPDPSAARRGCLVYVETDPVREQVKLAEGDPETLGFLRAHDAHFTYGWNLGSPECPIPTGGIEWRKTHPPVVVDLWSSRPHARGSWRTIATYRNRGKDVVWKGERYRWSKHPSFDRLLSLPSRSRERLEVALVAPEPVRARFLARGWRVADPYRVSSTAERYRRYVQGAKGEFSVEKEQYVRPRTGWFSDRTVCFLAAGRPCLVEDTGFGARIPTGKGLLAWRDLEQASEGLSRVATDYARHARAAGEIAREYFDASVLLPAILAVAGLRAAPS